MDSWEPWWQVFTACLSNNLTTSFRMVLLFIHVLASWFWCLSPPLNLIFLTSYISTTLPWMQALVIGISSLCLTHKEHIGTEIAAATCMSNSSPHGWDIENVAVNSFMSIYFTQNLANSWYIDIFKRSFVYDNCQHNTWRPADGKLWKLMLLRVVFFIFMARQVLSQWDTT